jgi:hypothetical protein
VHNGGKTTSVTADDPERSQPGNHFFGGWAEAVDEAAMTLARL